MVIAQSVQREYDETGWINSDFLKFWEILV